MSIALKGASRKEGKHRKHLVFSCRECGHSGTTYCDIESGFIAALQLATKVFKEYQLRRHGDKTPGMTIMGLAEVWEITSCAAESVLSAAARSRVADEANFILVGKVGWSVCVMRVCVEWGGAEKEGT